MVELFDFFGLVVSFSMTKKTMLSYTFSKRRKGMLYLTTHSIRLYGVAQIVKNHSYSERGNPLPPLYRLLFTISSNGSFICTTQNHTYHGLLHQSWSIALAGTRK